MYKLQTTMLSICRHKRRNILSCLLLTSVISVIFCGCFYRNYSQAEYSRVSERYTGRCRIAFRDELQYHPEYPHHSALDARLNGTSATDGVPDIFFDAEAMKLYDHPYPASLDMFQKLGNSVYCSDYRIAYAGNAYGFAEELPDRMKEWLAALYSSAGDGKNPDKIITEHIVVGGSLDAFTGIAREVTSGYLYDFILESGSEPESGECVITDFYAELYQKNIGDRITICDIYGNPVSELTISGIYGVYATERYEYVNPQVPGSGHRITGADLTADFTGSPDLVTPFDRLGENTEAQNYSQEHYFGEYFRIERAMIALIHTDLETAYHLYGTPETDPEFEERHHFNNYFAYYNLKDAGDRAAFEQEMKTIFPDDFREEFTVYTFDNSFQAFSEIPKNLLDTADWLLAVSILLTGILMLVSAVVLVRENGREIGIYLSLGISEGDILRKSALENTIVSGAAVLLAAFAGRFVHTLLSNGYTYLEMSGVQYSLKAESIFLAGSVLIINYILTSVITGIYIRVHFPVKLMRQED